VIWTIPCAGRTITVDANSTGDYPTIQAAIDAATDGDTVILQPGTYTGDGNRDIDFRGKAITVRSADHNDPSIVAATIIDCNGTEQDPHRGFHFNSEEEPNSVLAGVMVTNGWSLRGGGILCATPSSPTIHHCLITCNEAMDPGPYGWGEGGGIRCGGETTITDCQIVGNETDYGYGGGIACSGINVKVIRCLIADNTAAQGGGIRTNGRYATVKNCCITTNKGGGIYSQSRDLELLSSQIIYNEGAGIESHVHRLVIRNSHITGKRTGISCYGGDLVITNCLISGNGPGSRPFHGMGVNYHGGVWGGSVAITNSTITGNADVGLNVGSSLSDTSSTEVVVVNTIVRENRPRDETQLAIGRSSHLHVVISNNNIEGGPNSLLFSRYSSRDVVDWDKSNVDSDPCFVKLGHWDDGDDPEGLWDDFWVEGDYHLKSQAGRWNANKRRWTKDDVTSPCIDAGDPASPVGLEPFPNGGIVNIGAYGGTAEAGKSYFGRPVCETIVTGDINGDCRVDFTDFVFMALHWLEDYNP
jgi:hypothetical protein